MGYGLLRHTFVGTIVLGLVASLALISAVSPLRAANEKSAGQRGQTAQAPAARPSHPVYTNADVDKLDAQESAGNTSHRVYTNADVEKLAAEDIVPKASHQLYTNADTAKLASQDNISLVGPEPISEAAPTNAALPASYVAPYVETQDPNWYAEQAVQLNAELDRRNEDLRRYVAAIDEAKGRQQSESGVNLVEGNFGVTLDSGRAMLESRVREVESQLEELADLARRNGISAGNQ
jgi:NADH dehydrogenase/NADH:ubiquinone oxidoreductase subunit G